MRTSRIIRRGRLVVAGVAGLLVFLLGAQPAHAFEGYLGRLRISGPGTFLVVDDATGARCAFAVPAVTSHDDALGTPAPETPTLALLRTHSCGTLVASYAVQHDWRLFIGGPELVSQEHVLRIQIALKRGVTIVDTRTWEFSVINETPAVFVSRIFTTSRSQLTFRSAHDVVRV